MAGALLVGDMFCNLQGSPVQDQAMLKKAAAHVPKDVEDCLGREQQASHPGLRCQGGCARSDSRVQVRGSRSEVGCREPGVPRRLAGVAIANSFSLQPFRP